MHKCDSFLRFVLRNRFAPSPSPLQVTKACHGAYIRGKKEYVKLQKRIYGEEPTITIIEFIEIWGGCASLGYEGAWFSWTDAQQLRSAWRKTGRLGCIIAPEEIDRSSFVDRETSNTQLQTSPAPAAAPLTVEGAMTVPAGMRAGSLAAVTAQRDALLKYIEQSVHAPIDYVKEGILIPKATEIKKRERSKTRIDESEGGDSHLRGLAGKSRTKLDLKEAEEQAKLARREEREAKRARLEMTATANREAYNKCYPVCTCGADPCPWAGMHLCLTCGDIKRSICRKQSCTGSGQPLLLTMRPLELTATPEAMQE